MFGRTQALTFASLLCLAGISMAWFYPIAPSYLPYIGKSKYCNFISFPTFAFTHDVGGFCFGFSDAIEQTQIFSVLSTLFPIRVAAAMGFKLFIQAATTGVMFFIHTSVSFEAQSTLLAVFAVASVVSLMCLHGAINDERIRVRLGSDEEFGVLTAKDADDEDDDDADSTPPDVPDPVPPIPVVITQ
jgi:hypothetical protein